MTNYKIGRIVKGTVTGIETYGVFISLDEYYSGLIHISEISHGFVKSVHDFVKIGDVIYVEILDIDNESSHLKLSIKNIDYRVNHKNNKKIIEETSQGFDTLAAKLPIWLEEKLKKIKKIK